MLSRCADVASHSSADEAFVSACQGSVARMTSFAAPENFNGVRQQLQCLLQWVIDDLSLPELSVLVLPIGVIEQLIYCLLQVGPLMKHLLQGLQYALLASL